MRDEPFAFLQRKHLKIYEKSDEKSGIMESSVSKEYSFDKKNPIFEDSQGRFKIHWALEKRNNVKKIAKIYRKNLLDSSFTTKIKREIILLQNTVGDPFLLNFEKIFESNSHLYIIFEGGDLLLTPGRLELPSSKDIKPKGNF